MRARARMTKRPPFTLARPFSPGLSADTSKHTRTRIVYHEDVYIYNVHRESRVKNTVHWT